MSNPVLHIKDSYYFEVPKSLLPARYHDKKEFPDVWVRNDDQFQHWEAEQIYHGLKESSVLNLPDEHDLLHSWEHWQHEGTAHQNYARPLDVYLEIQAGKLHAAYEALPKDKRPSYDDYLTSVTGDRAQFVWFARFVARESGAKQWQQIKEHAGNREAVAKFKSDPAIAWSEQKIANYNTLLSGKILLYPQPFGELRNLYEKESGFCISKFMVLEVIISVLMFTLFTWVAGRITSQRAPKGRVWNLFEVFLLFIRDQVARPAIGGHHEEHHEDHAESHNHDHAHVHQEVVKHGDQEPHGHADVKSHSDHAHAKGSHHHQNEGDRFVPLLWTIFFFILFCNLFGLVPWLGSPTGGFGVTFGLALITLATVVVMGIAKFGVAGFFLNQIPSMDLPLPLAVVLKPMIFLIEMLGLFIKHAVLSIRLLANMVAGHLVILAILGLAFGAEAELLYSTGHGPSWQWFVIAPISVLGTVLLNMLELFVAFLQAYVFTLLSALFIGAAVHKH